MFGETSTQEEVYETTTAPLVRDVLDGYQAAVFAYGATGSGKTHTMLGNNPLKAATPNVNPNTPHSSEDGLMVRAIIQIFSSMQEEDDPDKIEVCFCCIYGMHSSKICNLTFSRCLFLIWKFIMS